MNNHLAVAQAFVQELRETQQNIVAILLAGSVARQQAAAFSDIDMIVIVPDDAEKQVGRSGSTWRNGIYIDVGFRPQSAFAQLEQILSNPSAATAMAFGMILYDPTGFLAALQAQVQTHYMQPRWLQARVQAITSRTQSRLEKLSAAVAVQDSLQICVHTGQIVLSIALLPLIREGIAPSSTRHLAQLAESEPELAQSICALEGSADMTGADIEAVYNVFAQLTMLGDTSRWGQLPIYMMRKVEWMSRHHLEHAAVHTMWNNVRFRINDCLATPGVADKTQRLAEEWLQRTGWMGATALSAKLQMAHALFEQVDAARD